MFSNLGTIEDNNNNNNNNKFCENTHGDQEQIGHTDTTNLVTKNRTSNLNLQLLLCKKNGN